MCGLVNHLSGHVLTQLPPHPKELSVLSLPFFGLISFGLVCDVCISGITVHTSVVLVQNRMMLEYSFELKYFENKTKWCLDTKQVHLQILIKISNNDAWGGGSGNGGSCVRQISGLREERTGWKSVWSDHCYEPEAKRQWKRPSVLTFLFYFILFYVECWDKEKG